MIFDPRFNVFEMHGLRNHLDDNKKELSLNFLEWVNSNRLTMDMVNSNRLTKDIE